MIVTLHSGEAFSGVLWQADARAWVLKDAVALGAGERNTDVVVDGEVIVPADNVAFAQRT